MMSKKQWVALLAIFTAYLLLGAGVFFSIEAPLEKNRREIELKERERILELVRLHYDNNETELLEQVARYCMRPFSPEPADMNDMEPELWTFYNSFFFVITVVSTIGYGNLAPTCMLSRILMIVYALVGIPMNGILLASLAEFFSKTLVRARARHKHQSSATLLADLARYLLPGAVVFLLLPGALFAYVEDWSYDTAVYYAFVTLTTIGFGDIVAGHFAGQTNRVENGPYLVYRVALVVWIVFGLGYLLMLLGLISRAMRSKRVTRLEHALAQQLRGAERRLARDLGFMRRVLNELYLQKVKPVYRDDDASSVSCGMRARSCSEPSLAGLGQGLLPPPRRSRACSEGAALTAHRLQDPRRSVSAWSASAGGRRSLVRVSSDSELARIDRNATFAAPEAAVVPARLLARFVSALGGAAPLQQEEPEAEAGLAPGAAAGAGAGAGRHPPRLHPGAAALGGGVHGFCDADILHSERAHPEHWTVGACAGHAAAAAAAANGWPQPPPAYDDARLEAPMGGTGPAEWTWSAPAAASQLVHGLARARKVAGNAALKAAEACADAAGAADTTPWWPPAAAPPGAHANGAAPLDLPPAARATAKRHSISAVLHSISRWRPLRRGAEAPPTAKKSAQPPHSPQPRGRPKSKSVADVFFFQRPHPHRHDHDDEQEEAEARVDAILEGTSLADLFRAVDALRRRDALARAARGEADADGDADACSSSTASSSASSSTPSSPGGGGGGAEGGARRRRRKNGAATTTPPYASLTSLFVPPSERAGALFALHPHLPTAHSVHSAHLPPQPHRSLLRRSSAAPGVLGAWGGSERRPSLRPGGGVAAALFARRPSAPHTLTPAPRSPGPAPASSAYFKRSARRFSVRPVPPSALPSAQDGGAGAEADAGAEKQTPPQPPPMPAPTPASVVGPLPARVRDLRAQVLQRQLNDAGVSRRRRDSLHDIVVQKP